MFLSLTHASSQLIQCTILIKPHFSMLSSPVFSFFLLMYFTHICICSTAVILNLFEILVQSYKYLIQFHKLMSWLLMHLNFWILMTKYLKNRITGCVINPTGIKKNVLIPFISYSPHNLSVFSHAFIIKSRLLKMADFLNDLIPECLYNHISSTPNNLQVLE